MGIPKQKVQNPFIYEFTYYKLNNNLCSSYFTKESNDYDFDGYICDFVTSL